MKKIILTLVAFAAFGVANAQDSKAAFKAGVSLGLPIGDAKDVYTLNIGVDAAYMWPISPEFSAGVGAGYSHYIGDTVDTGFFEVDVEDAGFVPIYGSAQYSITENFFTGADLGYGIAVAPSGADSGVYYQPKLGYQTSKIEVYAGYKAVSVSGGTFSSLNLGFNYKF